MEKRIGFIGCYSHDLILMLTKVLGCLGKRVLLRDQNQRRTLRASIPIPEGVSVARTWIEYDGFFFTEREMGTDGIDGYDVELIDFGMEPETGKTEQCAVLVIVTDMLLHHIRRLASKELPCDRIRACIIRDSFEDMCKGEKELKLFLQRFPNRKEFFLSPDYRDVRNRYVCETMHEYSLGKASPEMKTVIYRLVEMFCDDVSEKEIRRRVKANERRWYR